MAKNITVYGTGSWDTFTQKGIEYFRFRKAYENETKCFTGRTKKDVLDKIKKYEANPQNRNQLATLKVPFAKFANECALEFARIKRVSTPPSCQRSALLHLQGSLLGKTQLGSVNPSIVSDFLFSMSKDGYARKTINEDFSFIKRCLQYAVDKKILPSNPADKVAPLREDEVEKQTKVVSSLELDDIQKLLVEAKRLNTEEFRINGDVGTPVYGVNADIVCFLFYTGLRIGECLALTWDDIEIADGEMSFLKITSSLKEETGPSGKTSLYRGTTKTQSSKRIVSLCKQAREILQKQKDAHPSAISSDYVFVSEENTPIYRRNVNRTLQAMLKRAKCKNQTATVHWLRHSYGSYLISNGADIYAVSKLMGHSSIKVTENVYLDLLSKANKETSDIFDKLSPGA